VQWLKKLQYSELNIGGAGLIMSDLAVEYKHESFYGDELAVSIFTGEVTLTGFEIFYLVSNHLNTLIAKAKTGMVCYDYEKKKVTAIPEKFRELIARQQLH
jgi:acyl-CoA thioester hydrolase